VQDTYSIAVCESDPARMARCVGNRTAGFHVLTSADGGATWAFTTWNANFPTTMPLRVAISPTDPTNFVIIADGAAARVTSDGGASWRTVRGLPSGPSGGPWFWMQPITADRQLGGTFYYHDGAGKVYRSTDKGFTFTRVNGVTLDTQNWSTIRTLPGAASDVWVSLDTSGLYRSTDGGANFAKLSTVSRAYLFAFGKPAPGSAIPALYLYGRVNGSGDEIFRSLDLGATWTELTDSRVAIGDGPNVMEASAQTYGLVFIGANGRGIYSGQPISK
jgi:xyloglucan-specific exo-beta-1,4-glucanase